MQITCQNSGSSFDETDALGDDETPLCPQCGEHLEEYADDED